MSLTDADRATVLVVEDDAPLRHAIAGHLTAEGGYDVHEAKSGEEALGLVGAGGIDLMLLDIRLPDISGFEVIPEALACDRDLPIMMVSGLADAATAARCMQLGAFAYLTKPIELGQLDLTVQRGLRRRESLAARTESSPAGAQGSSPEEAVRARLELEQVITGTLDALVITLEAKQPTAVGHSHRVAALAATIADELGLDEDEVEEVRLAGRFHDLGKVGVNDAVLHKNEALSPEEVQHVRAHVEIGASILAPIPHLARVAELVLSHHEHWDGSGYPRGLARADIPIGGRILCAVEVFDALTTGGKDRPPLNAVQAVRRMQSLEGAVLDPDIVLALETAVAKRRTLPFLNDPDQPLNVSGLAMLPTPNGVAG